VLVEVVLEQTPNTVFAVFCSFIISVTIQHVLY